MTQTERLNELLAALLAGDERYAGREIPREETEKKRLLRALFNVRPPRPCTETFLRIQDEWLREETAAKGITEADGLPAVACNGRIALWKGDITTLRADAIVNAANSGMLGCFCPNHGCIDNAIHTAAGVQLRAACAEIMRAQGHGEEPGTVKITPGYNLPCKYVLHTVGPFVSGTPTQRDRDLLAACYTACLRAAAELRLESVAFCCISTGEFHFPAREAAEIAVRTVNGFLQNSTAVGRVIFNVFRESDNQIYRELLGSAGPSENRMEPG